MRDFAAQGYSVMRSMLDAAECQVLTGLTQGINNRRAGTRNLLAFEWCRELAKQLRSHPDMQCVFACNRVAVQCTYFEKSADNNWAVPMHQDLTIPVRARIDHVSWRAWSIKEGGIFVQPPRSVLERLLAVRVHLEPCGPDDGPLCVVPGSHKAGLLTEEQVSAMRASELTCPANAGDALVFRPLLLHRSGKATGISRRRVLHFVFGPPVLPDGAGWNTAV